MSERHFRVVQLEGKKVEFGGVSITSKASPGSAAKKLLTSIAHHKGLKKNKKASMPKVKYCIQEYTQGSSKKVYGPYVGHYHKYTAAELKKAETAGGKVKFTMKPVVKLAKGKNNMKGGGVLGQVIEKINNLTFNAQKQQLILIGYKGNQGILINKDKKQELINFLEKCRLPILQRCITGSTFQMKFNDKIYNVCYKNEDYDSVGFELHNEEEFSKIGEKEKKVIGSIIDVINLYQKQVSQVNNEKNPSQEQVTLNNNTNNILKDFYKKYLKVNFEVGELVQKNYGKIVIDDAKYKLDEITNNINVNQYYYILRSGQQIYQIPKDLSKFPKNFLRYY